jgi:hypothetical protein
VLDRDDNPRISYYDETNRNLKYAAFDGTVWQAETVDAVNMVGQYTSLALDGSGNPHISYYDETTSGLRYALLDGSTWQVATVDSLNLVGQYTSLVLDGAGRPHISYYDETNRDLKYASFDGVRWQAGTVDNVNDVGAYSALALDRDGKPFISYYNATNADLQYASPVPTTTTTIGPTTTTTVVSGPSIDLMPAAVFQARFIATLWRLRIEGTDTTFTSTDSLITFQPASAVMLLPPLVKDNDTIIMFIYLMPRLLTGPLDIVEVTVTTGSEVVSEDLEIVLLPFFLEEG